MIRLGKPAQGSRWVLGLVLISLVAYGYLWRTGPLRGGDTESYLEVARDLSDWRLERLHLRPPGFPVLVALTGSADELNFTLVAVQLALLGVALYAGRVLLRDLAVSTWVQWLFVGIGLMPHVVQVADYGQSESLAQSLLTLGFVAYLRGAYLQSGMGSVALASLLFGCAAITRPVYVVTSLVLAIATGALAFVRTWADIRTRLLGAALVVPLGTLIIVAGFGGWQKARFGSSSSPLLAMSLSVQMAPYIESLPEDYGPVREILLRHRDIGLLKERHHFPQGYVFTVWPELVGHFDGDEAAATRALQRANLEIIRRETRVFFTRAWAAFARYWEWYLLPVPGFSYWPVKGLMVLIHSATVVVFWSLFWTAAVVGLSVILPGRRSPLSWDSSLSNWPILVAWALAAAVVLSAATVQSVLGVGHPRYRLPTDQILVMGVCLGLELLGQFRREVLLARG